MTSENVIYSSNNSDSNNNTNCNKNKLNLNDRPANTEFYLTNDEEEDRIKNTEIMTSSNSNSVGFSSYGELSTEQIRRLDELLNQPVPVDSRMNYPTLHVKLKDFIRLLRSTLLQRRIKLRDVRINGGVASHILSKDHHYDFSDIDIIFACDLLQLNTENVSSKLVYTDQIIKSVDLKENSNPPSVDTTSQPQPSNYNIEASFATCCDVIKETVFDCIISYILSDPGMSAMFHPDSLNWVLIKDAYVEKMVKIYEHTNNTASTTTSTTSYSPSTSPSGIYSSPDAEESYESTRSLSRWSLLSLHNRQGQNVELKFVDKMKRQFQFSVDGFQIDLMPMLAYYDRLDEAKANNRTDISIEYPSVRAESMYGDFNLAMYHLDSKLVATHAPEEIRGGGLLKYCNLLVKGYRPECDQASMQSLEKYMCSRFFIDFSDIKDQQAKLCAYMTSHFQNDAHTCLHYLHRLYKVVNASTVCLMGHERKQTLHLIVSLAQSFLNSLGGDGSQSSFSHLEHMFRDIMTESSDLAVVAASASSSSSVSSTSSSSSLADSFNNNRKSSDHYIDSYMIMENGQKSNKNSTTRRQQANRQYQQRYFLFSFQIQLNSNRFCFKRENNQSKRRNFKTYSNQFYMDQQQASMAQQQQQQHGVAFYHNLMSTSPASSAVSTPNSTNSYYMPPSGSYYYQQAPFYMNNNRLVTHHQNQVYHQTVASNASNTKSNGITVMTNPNSCSLNVLSSSSMPSSASASPSPSPTPSTASSSVSVRTNSASSSFNTSIIHDNTTSSNVATTTKNNSKLNTTNNPVIICSASISSLSSSSSSSVSSIVPSPSPSPPPQSSVVVATSTIDDDLVVKQELESLNQTPTTVSALSSAAARVVFCKIGSSDIATTAPPSIEVYHNYYCPPILTAAAAASFYTY